MVRLGFALVILGSNVAHATPCDKIALDASNLYFIGGTDLFVAPRAGGPSQLLVEKAVPLDGACIVADGTRLLYASGSEVRAVAPTGGAPVTVAKLGAPVVDMSLDGGELVVATATEIRVAIGKPRVLAQSTGGIDSIVGDASTVYWADRDGKIKAVAKTGGTPRVVATGLDVVTDLALDDAGYLYYVANETLWRAPAAGGKAQRVASGMSLSSSIHVDAQRAYVVTMTGMVAVPKAGGSAKRLTGEYVHAVIVDGASVLWAGSQEVFKLANGKSVQIASALARRASPVTTQKVAPTWLAKQQAMPQEITLSPDGSTVFYVNSGDLSGDGPRIDWTLSAMPATGGKAQVIHKGFADVLVADATHVYFVGDDAIWSLPHAGGKPTQLAKISTADDMILGLAIDADSVYWTEHRAGLVRKVPKLGGTPTTLATKQTGPVRVVVDDAFVFWCETPIMRDGEEFEPAEILQRIGKQGGTVQSIVKSGSVRELALATDRIYWLADHGHLMTAMKDGSNVRPLAILTGAPQALAVAADGVYVTDSEDGTIRRVTPNGSVTVVYAGKRTWGVAAVGKVVVWTDMGSHVGTGSVARLP